MLLTSCLQVAAVLSIVSASPMSDSFFKAESDPNYNVVPFYPTPQGGRIEDGKWQAAYHRARQLVDQMTVVEKVNLTTGIGMSNGPCSGNTGSVPRLGIESLCLQDGPLSVRSADLTDVYPCGLAAASSFNKDLAYDRAAAIGREFKEKGVDIWLGPVYGPIGVKAQAGRNWEGHGPDPYLEGVFAYLQTLGGQSQGVIQSAKHLVGNEQELYRQTAAVANAAFGIKYKHNNTNELNSEIDDRAIHETYLWPFAEAVRAGVGSVMCSYNRLNGTHSCENSHLLNYLLKEELGFQGFVVTDWTALHSGVEAAIAGLDMDMPGEPKYWGPNLTAAALNSSVPIDRLDDMATRILAAKFAIGVNNPDGPNYSSNTFKTFDFEFSPQKQGSQIQVNKHVDVRTDENRAVSLRSAIEGIVLLKNENEALPLKGENGKQIAILGQAAGIDSKGANCAFEGCADGAAGTGYGSGAGTFSYFITPAEGIGRRAQEGRFSYEFIPDSWDQTAAVEAASYADAAVVVANSVAGEALGEVDGNPGDLNNLTLWHNVIPLIENVTSVNNNTIVIITSGGHVDLEPFIENENVTAVLFSSYLGQDYGTALAKVLFGDENPSGKLPFTFAKNIDDYVPLIDNITVDEPADKFETSIYVDYKYFDKYDKPVRYEFGYGLSYSNFTLSDIKVETIKQFSEDLEAAADYTESYRNENVNLKAEDATAPDDFTLIENVTYPYIKDTSSIQSNGSYDYPEGYGTEQLKSPASLAAGGLGGNPQLWDLGYVVTASVKNNGPYGGGFAPQLYVSFPDSDEFPTPPVQLRGFEKVFLDNGHSQSVSFELTRKDLSVWDTKSQSWKVLRGDYKFYVGSSSRQLDLVETVTIN
ncbi:beta-glucosidase [Wickerhamomyces ciferrii]|uniref:beta-glucosidase n=1 Tax=Wickerhamomyces ciferrii (strain ATCC 14091 / BCRC 22168 / CBS 111 / JCM 3599 / NBRC 0793 / NRRL Y-1031 F-60-10) TaxID=1206466 RepID=K0KVJ3_WICCF|nr:beta-glucosidase [Wickerhamomyces ciferrii]CCH45163.1 beta-glucosidase [Wickerhamomyces ciferrii]